MPEIIQDRFKSVKCRTTTQADNSNGISWRGWSNGIIGVSSNSHIANVTVFLVNIWLEGNARLLFCRMK